MRIAVVDDDMEDRQLLNSYIKNISYELNLKVEISTHALGENFLEDEDLSTLDAVFLDIYMGVKSGMDVAKLLRQNHYNGIIIFCTTTAEYALEGYEVKADNYILKPFTYEKIADQLKCISKILNESTLSIRIKEGRQWYKIEISEIQYVENRANYVLIHTFSKTYSTRMSLSQIEYTLLQHDCFVKCDRGIIVNMLNIQEIQNNTILLKNNITVPVSRRNTALVNDRYFDFVFKKME